MEETPTQDEAMPSKPSKKACQITLMFPVMDDAEAMHIKARVDVVVNDIKEKRYNFSISEV